MAEPRIRRVCSSCVNADWPCVRVPWSVVELRLRARADRPVRVRRVASADGSLTMITCGRGLKRAEACD
jgi:hypothetical protein